MGLFGNPFRRNVNFDKLDRNSTRLDLSLRGPTKTAPEIGQPIDLTELELSCSQLATETHKLLISTL